MMHPKVTFTNGLTGIAGLAGFPEYGAPVAFLATWRHRSRRHHGLLKLPRAQFGHKPGGYSMT
jgi:hypothetical protein